MSAATYADSPEIDGRVLFHRRGAGARRASSSMCVMTGVSDGDLTGEIEEGEN